MKFKLALSIYCFTFVTLIDQSTSAGKLSFVDVPVNNVNTRQSAKGSYCDFAGPNNLKLDSYPSLENQ